MTLLRHVCLSCRQMIAGLNFHFCILLFQSCTPSLFSMSKAIRTFCLCFLRASASLLRIRTLSFFN